MKVFVPVGKVVLSESVSETLQEVLSIVSLVLTVGLEVVVAEVVRSIVSISLSLRLSLWLSLPLAVGLVEVVLLLVEVSWSVPDPDRVPVRSVPGLSIRLACSQYSERELEIEN